MIHKSLNERAHQLGIATDFPALNRAARRRDLKLAIKEEKKARKKTVKTETKKFIGRKAA